MKTLKREKLVLDWKKRQTTRAAVRYTIETVLDELSAKDSEILRMLFLQDCDKADLCRRFGVTEDYVRVLLHRAKSRFRTTYFKSAGAVQ